MALDKRIFIHSNPEFLLPESKQFTVRSRDVRFPETPARDG